MRALRSLATIGFVFAVLGAAPSPSFAEPEPPSFAVPCDAASMGTCEVGRALWREREKQRQERVKKLLNAPLQKNSTTSSGPVIGVASKGMQNKGAPQRPPTGGHDWITPKTKAATTPTQSLYKPVSSLGVKPSVRAQPQTLYKPVTSLGVKPSVTTTNQILYKPVTSLGVKPSVPSTPQQKR